MTVVDATVVVLWLGIAAYAVLGGADFGAGFWDLVAGGAKGGLRQRALIADSIGPVWEANHTWLVFDLVILWTAFSPAIAAVMTALIVPISLVAFGMVLRGAAFAFRPVATGLRSRQLAGVVFAASSVVTPFFLGAIAGSIAGGRVPADGLSPDPWSSWLNPTSVLVGILAVVVCAYLAAVFLVADAHRRGDAELVVVFRRRAIAAAAAAGMISFAGIAVIGTDAPILARELTSRSWPLVAASGVLGTAALAMLWRGAPGATRLLAVGAVLAVLLGWGVAQFPYVLPPTLTFQAAASPAGSLEALLVVFIGAALVIAPSLALLFWLDERDRLVGHGVGSDAGTPSGAGLEDRGSHR